jgi:hypothetical protein
MSSHKSMNYVLSVLNRFQKQLNTSKYSKTTIREMNTLLNTLKTKLTNKIGGSPNFESLPTELQISIMKNLTPGDIRKLCSTNKNIKSFCDNSDNWRDIQRSVIRKIDKTTSNEYISKIYKIIEDVDPFLKNRDELLAYAILTGNEQILNFFKRYFFSFQQENDFTDEDIQYIEKYIRKYILEKDVLSSPKSIKIKHNNKTIKFLDKDSDVFLFQAIKKGKVSKAIELLDKFRNEGNPVFRWIGDCINYAEENYNVISELLYYFIDYDSDYFSNLDDTETEFLNEIHNSKVKDFVRNWLKEHNYYMSGYNSYSDHDEYNEDDY